MITILTTGSRGDTQPYLALGLALKKQGQTVRVAAFENFESFVKSYGLDYYPIRGDVSKVASGESVKLARNVDNPLKLLLSFNELRSLIVDLQVDFFNACKDSDAIVYHPGAAIGFFAAQYFKIPSILATPFPMTPTKDYPSSIFYDKPRLGRGFNWISHKIFEQIMWFAASSAVKQFWKKQFGRPPVNFGCPYGRQTTPALPTIVSCSNFVFPRPKDWPENVYNTGYWFLDEDPDGKPSQDLLDFLGNGMPPIYVGFGSVGDPTLALQTTELVIQALKQSGQRGILATGWNGMSSMGNIPDDIFILESAPHSWLFPRMAAVVHHGGAGTTAAGLRAGVPSMIIPHSNDQFAWGRRVYELGVSSKPIPRKNLTAENLSAAMNIALTPHIIDNAKDLGTKIQSENGAEAAAKIITQCLG